MDPVPCSLIIHKLKCSFNYVSPASLLIFCCINTSCNEVNIQIVERILILNYTPLSWRNLELHEGKCVSHSFYSSPKKSRVQTQDLCKSLWSFSYLFYSWSDFVLDSWVSSFPTVPPAVVSSAWTAREHSKMEESVWEVGESSTLRLFYTLIPDNTIQQWHTRTHTPRQRTRGVLMRCRCQTTALWHQINILMDCFSPEQHR